MSKVTTTTNEKSVQDVLAQIETEAAKNVCADERFILNHEIGKHVRQGDIYIHCVAPDHPRGTETQNRQLAQGTSQGARHMAAGIVKVFEGTTLPEWVKPGYFLGPVIVSDDRFEITHPEHATICCPAGTYQITHQTDAITRQRVLD